MRLKSNETSRVGRWESSLTQEKLVDHGSIAETADMDSAIRTYGRE